MRRRTALGIAAAASGGAAAAGVALLTRGDRRAVSRDPEHALLRDPPQGRHSGVVGAGGCELHVEEFGPADGPPVVLVHGWTCTRQFWIYQVRALSDRYRVITFDLRGHGLSEAPRNGDFSTDALADDLERVLVRTLGEDGRAVLAGHSLGAMTIAAWAGRHPGAVGRRAAAVAMVNTGLGDLISESLVLRLPGPLGAPRKVVGRALLGAAGPLPPRNPFSHRVIRHLVLSPSASPARVAFCENMVLACRHEVRAGFGRTLSRLELHDAIDHIGVPSVVVAGEEDRLTPMAHAERLARELPACERVVRLPGTGHMGPVEAPDAVEAVIRDLARRHLEPAQRRSLTSQA